jgi:hypothetical protein
VPNWKKLIVSGSDAMLNSVTTPQGTVNNISASYSLTSSYVNPLIQNVLITGSLNVSGSILLPSISQGTNETNIVVTDSSGSLKYRSNLSLQGTTGVQGITGTQGTTGAQGIQGVSGATFAGYDYEIHVSQVDGNDTTGDGDLLNPVATITKGLTLIGSQRKTIIVHPGIYTENPSITTQYTTITGPGLIGGNILISGTVSTNNGCTISGIKMTNLNITAPTGAGNVNILNCEISGTLTKSSNTDYTVLRLCDYSAAYITGGGLVAIFGGNPNFTTVNNANANVIIKSAVTVAPVLTAGSLSLVDSIVVAAVTNAFTSAAGTFTTLANSQFLISSEQSANRSRGRCHTDPY